MNVADHHAEANAAVGEDFVQAVLLPREHPGELLHLTRDEAQATKVGRGHEAASQQSAAGQNRQPLRIAKIRLASGDLFDVPGIDHQRAQARTLQRRVGALPVDPGTLHHHRFRCEGRHPLRHGAAIPLEAAELP